MERRILAMDLKYFGLLETWWDEGGGWWERKNKLASGAALSCDFQSWKCPWLRYIPKIKKRRKVGVWKVGALFLSLWQFLCFRRRRIIQIGINWNKRWVLIIQFGVLSSVFFQNMQILCYSESERALERSFLRTVRTYYAVQISQSQHKTNRCVWC